MLNEASSGKREARRFARKRKKTEERILRGTMFFPHDFTRCMEAAKTALDGVCSSFTKFHQDKSLEFAWDQRECERKIPVPDTKQRDERFKEVNNSIMVQ